MTSNTNTPDNDGVLQGFGLMPFILVAVQPKTEVAVKLDGDDKDPVGTAEQALRTAFTPAREKEGQCAAVALDAVVYQRVALRNANAFAIQETMKSSARANKWSAIYFKDEAVFRELRNAVLVRDAISLGSFATEDAELALDQAIYAASRDFRDMVFAAVQEAVRVGADLSKI